MKNIFLSILIIVGLVSSLTGATMSSLKDNETNVGNTFAAGILDFELDEVSNNWKFPFKGMKPGDTTGLQRLRLQLTDSSVQPNHLEIDVDTASFESGVPGMSTKDGLTKQIEVKQLYLEDINRFVTPNDWHWIGLINKIDDTKDGNTGFKSLYDLENSGILDDISILQKEIEFRIELGLPQVLPDSDDGKYQGDRLDINFEFGMAQSSGQDILTD